jgi:glycosyltransferase involved in cell wall biosynthesis
MSDARIRVLYLQPAPLFGGAERQASEQALFLPSLDIDLTVMGGPGTAIAEWMSDAKEARFVHCEHFPAWSPQTGLRALTSPFRYIACGLRARAEFAKVVEQRDIQLIVASLPFAWIVGTLVARTRGLPIIWRAGGSRITRLETILVWLLGRLVRPDLLLCNGEAVRQLFGRLIPARVAVLRNGVDARLFGPNLGDAARYRPPQARVVIGYAGRLAPSKHPEQLISLAARLRATRPGAELIVAGDGSERARCERLARDKGADNVTFLGFVSDMASFYAACDIVVLPSDSEGCSNVLLESMTSEKAVVASDIAAVGELLKHGDTGLLVPLGDNDALFHAVIGLIDHPDARHRLGRRAAASVRGLTARGAATHLARILREVAGRSGKEADRERSVVPRAEHPWPASLLPSSRNVPLRTRLEGRRRTY